MKRMLSKIKGLVNRGFLKSLDFIEIVGNKLPHPATIFGMLAVLVIGISALAYYLDVSAVHPVKPNGLETYEEWLEEAEANEGVETKTHEDFLNVTMFYDSINDVAISGDVMYQEWLEDGNNDNIEEFLSETGVVNEITINNLLTFTGLRWIYTNILHNFLFFPPLGYVFVVMIGIGVAEGSGLFTVMVRSLVIKAPPRFITAAIVLAGILSSLASEIGYIVLIPLGALIFHALGRHPMAGLAAAFCGVSGGFGSNLSIGAIDVILAGISESAAQIIDAEMSVNPAVNYYFMFASTFIVVIVGTWITEKIVEPRLGKYDGPAKKVPIEQLTEAEKKGFKWAGISLLLTLGLLALTVVPENGIFRDPETGSILNSPFFDGIIVGITVFFFIPGLVYGIVVKSINNDKDVVKHITKSMQSIAGYIVLVFFAAQFVYFFNYSNLGIIFAIKGASGLQQIGLTGAPLIVGFVLLSAVINMFMGSASAKWAILAPVFIPMLMLIEPAYHPGLTQVAFRIGDSVTNLITPMMSYFALIVTYAEKYDERYGIGTIISTMIPYTLLFFIFWTAFLVIWMMVGIPLGPDGPIFIP